ncbi:MAG: hypothetical protein JO138_18660 [Acidobacteriaceae bacterium]|nr:hypothetical protein [Acidobacteriaceae bacterium]
MHLLQVSGSFLSPDSPLGFGASDFAELALFALLVAFFQLRPQLEHLIRTLAGRRWLSAACIGILPVVLRLMLLPHHPVPSADVYDEFGHLLAADTLRHFRLANPPHRFHQFFETFFVLQQPTYSSIYPLGQGMALAVGWMLFGLPWAGVVLSIALFCASCYWMLRGWISPPWALIGGSLSIIEFGPLNQWMNSYWGGAVSAIAGCLIFGALPRLVAQWRTRDAILLGAGLGIQLITRPYESILLVLSVALYFTLMLRTAPQWVRLLRTTPVITLAMLPAIALTLLQNKEVTGKWTTLPYSLSQYQYGVPMSLTIQPNPVPHLPLTREQELEYKSQRSFHGEAPDSLEKFFARLEYRVRFYRFFFLPPLYLALLVFLITIREARFVWVLLAVAVFAAGSNLFPYFYPRYVAAVTSLFVLVSVVGLERLGSVYVRGWPAGRYAAALILFVCVASFAVWCAAHLFENTTSTMAVTQYERWDSIDTHPERRILVRDQLAKAPGRQLVFVRYWPNHVFQNEWVYNAADLDRARIIWARDLGPEQDEMLRRNYPDRTAWLLEPDADPPKLTPYETNSTPSTQFLDVK